jgi:hypothetical protein
VQYQSWHTAISYLLRAAEVPAASLALLSCLPVASLLPSLRWLSLMLAVGLIWGMRAASVAAVW